MIVILILVGLVLISAKPLQGLIAAVYTPFGKDFSLNTTIIPSHAKYLKDLGVIGVFVGGTTGESLSLTLSERKTLSQAWVTAGHQYNLTVIIHVGADSLKEARELSNHSLSIGADAISAMSPVFFRPSSPSVLVECMKYIAAGAPTLPFYYYHLPSMTGVTVDIVEFFKLAVKEIPSFTGIKFSDAIINDITEIQWLMKDSSVVPKPDNLAIYFGRDEQYDSALYMGVDGGVGSTYGYATNIYNQLTKAYKEGDYALSREWQYKSEKFIRIFAKYSTSNVNAHKYLCSRTTGLDFGPPRLPYVELSEENKVKMIDELTQIGYFDWVKPNYEPVNRR